MKVVNMFGGPGTGKSTVSAGLFYLMKLRAMDVELVTEYAKDLVWSERGMMFTEQDYIFAKQNHRLRRLRGKIDWAISDSPIILGHFYMPDDFPGKEPFSDFVNAMYNSYDNINIHLVRQNEYDPTGRNQTEEEAIEIDNQILTFLKGNVLDYLTVPANEDAAEVIFKHIIGE